MTHLTKRQKMINEKIEAGKLYAITDAIRLLKECSTVKFVESVEVAINLGIDARKSEQAIRGATVLPHGAGRTVRVAVFAQGENAKAAEQAGADKVGFEDLADSIEKGNIDFDVLIATPDAMRIVGKLGQILGPKGLMPNPKVGTVTPDVAKAVKNAKSGQAQFRTDKNGIIHCAIGKINFELNALEENLKALLADLKKLKPTGSKGIFLKKITLSTTMGPGLLVDQTSLK